MRGMVLLGLGWLATARLALGQEPVVTVRAGAVPLGPSVTLAAEPAAQGAGTQGDPAKAVQSVPGLGRGGPGSELVAWGSEPRESRVELDGVELPQLYHGSGLRSVIAPTLIEFLSVTPGAFAADHGRATGGLLQLRSRAIPRDQLHASARVDSLDAAATASTPFARGQAAALGAVRYGYVDRWLPHLIEPAVRGLFDVPRYWDASGALEISLPGAQRARLVGLTSSDASAFEVMSADPSQTRRAERETRFGRVYLDYRAPSDDSELQLTPFVGWDDDSRRELAAERTSSLSIRAFRYGVRARHDAQLSSVVGLTLGLDAAGALAHVMRKGSASVPRREGDPYPFGTPPGRGFARDDFRAHILGVGSYAQLSLRHGALSLQPGLRFEPTLIETSRARPPIGGLPDVGTSQLQFVSEPRLAAELRVARRLRLFAAAGLYHQPPDPADLGARFGNPALGISKATHVAVGEGTQLAERTRLELTLFSKWLHDLPVRSPDGAPRLAESLVAEGEGRVLGAQLFLRQGERLGFSGWLSITLSRSQRKAPYELLRPSDYDSPLVVALVLEKKLGRWRLGARARYASGLPRTPVTGAFYDLAASRYQPELGLTNSARLDDFAELDLRVDRSFRLGAQAELEVYLDFLNVTGRRNQEELIYASDFRTRAGVTGLPPLLVAGVKMER